MFSLLLLDIRTDPVSSFGIGAIVVLAIIVLAIVAALIGAFVLLLMWRKRRNAGAPIVGAPIKT